jgi:toxin FitB
VTNWLLDTNILAELRRPRPESRVVRFIEDKSLEQLFVSTVTFAEIRFGIERAGDPTHRAELHTWLANRIRPMFRARELAITEDVMVRWRLMVEEGRRSGHTFAQPDLIIAATAALHDMTVVTRDTADFARTRVPVLNPWADDTPSLR